MKNYPTSHTIEEIKNKSRHHTVTHVVLWEDIPPNINTLFPHLTHLGVSQVYKNADWTRYDIAIVELHCGHIIECHSCLSNTLIKNEDAWFPYVVRFQHFCY